MDPEVAKEKEAFPETAKSCKWKHCKDGDCKEAKKCCKAVRCLFTLLLIAGFITTTVYMFRYKHELCQLNIDHGIQEMERNGFQYEVLHHDCKVQRVFPEEVRTAKEIAETLGCAVPTADTNPVKCGGFRLFLDGHMEDKHGHEVTV